MQTNVYFYHFLRCLIVNLTFGVPARDALGENYASIKAVCFGGSDTVRSRRLNTIKGLSRLPEVTSSRDGIIFVSFFFSIYLCLVKTHSVHLVSHLGS